MKTLLNPKYITPMHYVPCWSRSRQQIKKPQDPGERGISAQIFSLQETSGFMRSPWSVCVCMCRPINFRTDRFYESWHERNATEAHPHIVSSKYRTISNNMANAGSCQVGSKKTSNERLCYGTGEIHIDMFHLARRTANASV